MGVTFPVRSARSQSGVARFKNTVSITVTHQNDTSHPARNHSSDVPGRIDPHALGEVEFDGFRGNPAAPVLEYREAGV